MKILFQKTLELFVVYWSFTTLLNILITKPFSPLTQIALSFLIVYIPIYWCIHQLEESGDNVMNFILLIAVLMFIGNLVEAISGYDLTIYLIIIAIIIGFPVLILKNERRFKWKKKKIK